MTRPGGPPRAMTPRAIARRGVPRRGVARAAAVLALAVLGACGNLQRLSEVGRPPVLSPSSDPTRDPAWKPLTMPMPAPLALVPQANALWRPGSRAFLKDERASQVGDLVTVLVTVNDNADFKDNTTSNRAGTQTLGATNLFGLETKIPTAFPGATAGSLINTNGGGTVTGTGEIKRTEAVALRLAGVVTQVLANGNLVIAARQEMEVNNELRVLTVTGVARPSDIASDNTVLHDRMAEARITYGGRGQLTDAQAPRYGQQILDILSPF
jgi:flagellar L-ring protein precursor FlgH